MSDTPPPQCVNIRKAVTRAAHYEGELSAEQLPRSSDLLGPGALRIQAAFGRDEEHRQVVDVVLAGTVELECQRCLKPVAVPVESRSRLGLVLTDEQAQGLPKTYEPWIAIDEVDLWAMAEEELALALPVVAYHRDGECRTPAPPRDTEENAGPEDGHNPFDVLSSLLDGAGDQERD